MTLRYSLTQWFLFSLCWILISCQPARFSPELDVGETETPTNNRVSEELSFEEPVCERAPAQESSPSAIPVHFHLTSSREHLADWLVMEINGEEQFRCWRAITDPVTGAEPRFRMELAPGIVQVRVVNETTQKSREISFELTKEVWVFFGYHHDDWHYGIEDSAPIYE